MGDYSSTEFPDPFSMLMRSVKGHAIFLMDGEGVIRAWNPGAARIFGYAPEEILGRKGSLLFTPEDAAAGIPESELVSAQAEGVEDDERWHVRKDGGRFWASSSVYPLLKENGEAAGFVKFLKEYSRQRKSAQDLIESERKLDFIIAHLRDHAIFLIGGDGRIAGWNGGSQDVFGYAEEEIVGQPFATLFTPVDVKAGVPEKELRTALSAGKAEDERWHRRKDGSYFWASGAVVPIEREGSNGLFIKVLRDATERKRAEDADRMESIGRLAGGVAHDFNNMLTSILGYAELLLKVKPDPATADQWLSEILAAGRRASLLTRDLLIFGRRQVMAPVPVNLNDVIKRMEELFKRSLGEDIRLSTRLEPKLDTVLIDQGLFEQLLFNLAINAREAMPSGGEILITTANESPEEIREEESDSGPHVVMTFKDTGKGMDVETLSRVFEPFFSTKAKKAGSVGMGLSTVYGTIRQSGGNITVSSDPGHGAEFRILLPVTAQESAAGEASPPETAGMAMGNPPEGQRRIILLVEDETAMRKLAAQALTSRGMEVLEAKDGEEALALFALHRDRINLILTDVVMPKMGGLEMAHNILADFPGFPIIYMSGYAGETLTPHGKEQTQGMFLQKPFSVETLLAKIEEAIQALNALPRS